MKQLFILPILLMLSGQLIAGEIKVAVASNFANALKDISARFEKNTGHTVKLSIGSTGKHYAQIINGAPFDLFFAADTRRPELLDTAGISKPGSRFTYAQGKLVLWSPQQALVDAEGKVLELAKFDYLAIANPKLAPYGKAAQQVLQKRGVWKALRQKMVRGENIGQTFQFVKSGNAQLGFVAASQVKQGGIVKQGSYWEVPQHEYSEIYQQAVLLTDSHVAQIFLTFMRSDEVYNLIRRYGYQVP